MAIETTNPCAIIQPTGNDWYRTSLTFTTLLRPDWFTRWEHRAAALRSSCMTQYIDYIDFEGDEIWDEKRNWRWWAGYRQVASLIDRILARPELDVWVPGEVTYSQFAKHDPEGDAKPMIAQAAGPVLIRNVEGLFDLSDEGFVTRISYNANQPKHGIKTEAAQFTAYTDIKDGVAHVWGAQMEEK